MSIGDLINQVRKEANKDKHRHTSCICIAVVVAALLCCGRVVRDEMKVGDGIPLVSPPVQVSVHKGVIGG